MLFRRLFLGRRLLPSLAVPFTIGFVFTATYWVANGFALSGQQIALRELGRFDHAVAIDVEPGDLNPSSVDRVARELATRGVRESSIEIVSTDVRPDQLGVEPTAGPQKVLSYTQSASPPTDFPTRYRLTSGRWPRRAGEVVLTARLRDRLGEGTFTAFDGMATFETVGTFDDRFDTESTAILAAPGTWETIPARASRAFALQGALRVLWAGSGSASTVASVARRALALAPPPGGNRPAIDRASLVRTRDQSLSDHQRLLFAYPLWLLSAMAAISTVRSNRRWTRAYGSRCRDVGLPKRRVRLVIGGVLTSGVMVAVAVGIAGGAIVGSVVRGWGLPRVLTQPVGPMRSLSPVMAAALVMGVWTALLQVLDVGSGASRRMLAKVIAEVPWALIRRVVAVLALLRGIQAATRPTVHFDDLGGSGVLITAFAVLMAPDLMNAARLWLPRGRPRTMLARRMIDADRGGLALVSMIVAASLAFPITMSSYNTSARRSNDAGFAGMVRPHQLWVDGSDPRTNPRPIASAVASALPGVSVIDLRGTNAFVYPTGGKPVENTAVATVPSPDDLVLLLGDASWVRQMAGYVAGGGIAFLDGPTRPVHRRNPDDPGTIELPARAFGEDQAGLLAPFAAVMLAETAAKVGLHTAPLATVFAHVSQAQTDASIVAVREAGLDVRLLRFYTPPPRTSPTPESYFALGGLLVLASFLLVGLMRAVGERMRERSGQLLAVGFRRRWSASVAALQLGLAVTAGMLMGVAGSSAAVWVFVSTPDHAMLLAFPTRFIALTLGLVAAVSLIGIVACIASVRARADADF